MSTKLKKSSKQGLRYTAEQKREVVNFVNQYNNENGRGGQAAAFKKYGVAVLSISNWLKEAAASAPAAKPAKAAKVAKAAKPAKAAKVAKPAKAAKAAKPAKAAKAAKPAPVSLKPVKVGKRKAKAPQGTRYTLEEKQAVLKFVEDYNARNRRGGMTAAARKFKITPLTVTAWINKLGGGTKKAKAAAGDSAPLLKKIAQLEATVASLKAKLARKK